jgi:hypothetical protein
VFSSALNAPRCTTIEGLASPDKARDLWNLILAAARGDGMTEALLKYRASDLDMSTADPQSRVPFAKIPQTRFALGTRAHCTAWMSTP